MTDEQLSEAYQRAVASRTSPGRAGCASPEALLALAQRTGPEAERLATLDHAMACAACKGELDLLLAVERAGAEVASGDGAVEGRPTSAPVPLRPRAARRAPAYAAMALAASLLVAIGVVVARRPAEAPEVMRGEAAAVTATRPAPGETVRVPITFAWEPVPGASRYTVEVVAPDGQVAWSTETSEARATLNDVGVLRGGGEYRWWVRVTGGPAHQRTSEPRLVRVAGR